MACNERPGRVWPIASNIGGHIVTDVSGFQGDDSGRIQAAIDAVVESGHGGVVFFPAGEYHCARGLNLNQAVWKGAGITLAGPGNASFQGGAHIIYAPEVGWRNTPFIQALSAQSVGISDLSIIYASTFTGDLIHFDANNCTPLPDGLCRDIHIANCMLNGAKPSANSLIRLNNTDGALIEGCTFGNTRVGIRGCDVIKGPPSSVTTSDHITVRDCQFLEGAVGAACVKNARSSWLFASNNFEGGADGRARFYRQDPGYAAKGLTFLNCWFGDITNPAGSAAADGITLQVEGLNVVGCVFGDPNAVGMGGTPVSSQGASLRILAGSKGVSVTGSRFHGADINFDGPSTEGVILRGNSMPAFRVFETSKIMNTKQLVALGNHPFPNSP